MIQVSSSYPIYAQISYIVGTKSASFLDSSIGQTFSSQRILHPFAQRPPLLWPFLSHFN